MLRALALGALVVFTIGIPRVLEAAPAATAATSTRAPQKRASVSPQRQARAIKSWHAAAAGKKAAHDERGRPMLTLYALNTGERLEIAASGENGAFASRDLDRVAHLFRESASGHEHPIEPRLLDLLYRIQRKFDAHEIRLVSGFRAGRGAPQKAPVRAAGSNHACGRAADIIVPGARDEDVAKFARELGFVGVGVYPTSGFVHVDVRGSSYFWVDRSGPGKRNRTRGILTDLAKKSDARAITRGERPTDPFAISLEVESTLEERPEADAPDEDDDV